jgi:glucose/arabinose dehydrogenase
MKRRRELPRRWYRSSRGRPAVAAVAAACALALQACGGSDAPAEPTAGTGTENCPEIFASGFRNPWRWSFDRQSGELWVGDVGQGQREEIDRVERGGNYGWRCFEGTVATGFECGTEPNLLPPVAEYAHPATGTPNRSVTGGYVYRGNSVMDLEGRYVFGDFITGEIWHIPATQQPTVTPTAALDTNLNISSFGEGNDGELYVVHYSGELHGLTGSAVALGTARVFPNLTFAAPVAMLQVPGDSARWFVVEQAGRVRVFDNDQAAVQGDVADFVDISGRVAFSGEMGLLGMAFHPDFATATTKKVYLSYTNISTPEGRISRISEFTSADGGLTLDPNSERILMVVGQPEANHNGGHVAFGPDGHLYIGMGDGGGANDPHGAIGNGQRMTTLLGKMLRIDVNSGSPYGIPADNPFVGNALCGAPS